MNYVITLHRQFGSGGSNIAQAVADMLQIEYLDKRIIEQLSEKTGLAKREIQEHDWHGENFWQRNKLLFNAASYDRNQVIFAQQKAIIREHAAAHSCVILGRSSDAILADFDNVLNVFVYAPVSFRAARLGELYKFTLEESMEAIKRMDAQRSDYRSFFGHNIDRSHLRLDSSLFGVDKAARVIVTAARELFGA